MQKANETGIVGTVRNLEDNHTVEIIATGNDNELAAFLNWCNEGSPKADVTGMEIVELALQEFENFSIL
ncbi:acylphosphatase [Niabella ginsengisoli]|uniref:Acylphosphatase n=1 Tax=Niabella ginsengisoli TaxID=522298 RepID=A0ABS9SL81_9BACT|nr:acylphosphatase [Niabella ginsengisoli]